MQLNMYFDSFNSDKQILMPILWFNQTATIKPDFYNSMLFQGARVISRISYIFQRNLINLKMTRLKAILPLYSIYYIHCVLLTLASILFFIFGFLYFKSKPIYTELQEEENDDSDSDSVHTEISSHHSEQNDSE